MICLAKRIVLSDLKSGRFWKPDKQQSGMMQIIKTETIKFLSLSSKCVAYDWEKSKNNLRVVQEAVLCSATL